MYLEVERHLSADLVAEALDFPVPGNNEGRIRWKLLRDEDSNNYFVKTTYKRAVVEQHLSYLLHRVINGIVRKTGVLEEAIELDVTLSRVYKSHAVFPPTH